jgi:hypothetical protein
MIRRAAAAACVLLAVLALASSSRAGTPIQTFDSNITVNQDGSALVIESIDLALASGNFDRDIRTNFPGAFGRRRLLIDVIEVRDAKGNDIPYFTMKTADALTVRIPRVRGRSLRIAYSVSNAVHFSGNGDDFFWIVNNVASPAGGAFVHITLPPSAAGQFRAQSYLRLTGMDQSRTELWSYNGVIPHQVDGAKIDSESPGPIGPDVAMILDVFAAKGVFTPPGPIKRAEWFVRANPVVLLPLGALLVMLILRKFKPRDPQAERSIVPVYDPPAGLTPAEVGVLIDDRLDPRDVCATLVDLAVRGFVRLEETASTPGVASDSPDYIVKLLKPREEWSGLAPHEYTMLFHTFYGGQWTKLSSLRLRFPDIVPYMQVDILRELKRKGMYRVDPEAAQGWRVVGLLAVAGLFGFAQLLGIVRLANTMELGLTAVVVAAFAVYWFGRGTSAKTLRGMHTWTAIHGFQEFMRSVESDRLQRMEPSIFEKYLPYAMALGIEHKWTRAFQGIAIHKPDWVEMGDLLASGSAAFSPENMGHALDLMFHSALVNVAPHVSLRGLARASRAGM